MKRILYNSKLKKILSSLLLVMLIFQFIFPTYVFAEEITDTKSYKTWITEYAEYKDEIYAGVEFYCTVEIDLFPDFKDTTSDNAEKKALLAEKLSDDDFAEGFLITGTLETGWVVPIVGTRFGENFTVASVGYAEDSKEEFSEVTKTYAEFLEWTGKTEEEVYTELAPFIEKEYLMEDQALADNVEINGEKVTKEELSKQIIADNKDKIIITVIGTSDDYDILSVEIPDKNRVEVLEPYVPEEEEEADLGGILLSPVFYLVNFIADAITSNLGRIMYPGSGSSWHGVDILVSSPAKTDYTKTSETKVYMSNALGTIQYPNIKYTPEEIFSGKIDLLSIDFISGKNADGDVINGDWSGIRKVISSWYKVLRMIAIIGLLSVLIYTGIKIIISSNAKDKAKYKEWIINWFIAVAILFSMHYIMSFIISVIGEINSLLGNACQGILVKHKGGWPFKDFTTNLMGLVRFMIQSEDFSTKVGYEVMYIALIVYTIKFTVVYLKRVLNMAFLTLIAPIVALTYPIDKMNDGSAQGFNMWLKEYIFNALLQPMHYLMYYVLVGSAVSIAASNPLYGIVVLLFMSEAERLLKKIFGFDKAGGGTVGGMTNAFTAGAVASQIGNLAKRFGGNALKGGNGGNGNGDTPELPPTVKDANNVEDNFSGGAEGTENSGASGNNNGEDETVQQQMLDAYDDNYNTNEWDPGDRDAMAREAYAEDKGTMPSEDEYRQILMESGYDGEELERAMIEGGYGSNEAQNEGQSENGTASNQEPPTTSPDSGKPISRMSAGAKALGKKALKPIWDLEKSKKYNGKRLIRKIGRTAAGVSLGVAAAAVQAGISITDGKYNAFEGIASFGAGWAGGKRLENGIANTAKGIKSTFDQGYHSEDNKEQKKLWEEKQRQRYYENWIDRDDVNKVFKDKFGEKEFMKMKEKAKNYTDRGYTDPKEVAKLMKASKTLGWDDKTTISAMNFKKQLQDQQSYGAVSDLDKRKKYIQSIIDNRGLSGNEANKVKRQYEEAFRAVSSLDDTMRK